MIFSTTNHIERLKLLYSVVKPEVLMQYIINQLRLRLTDTANMSDTVRGAVARLCMVKVRDYVLAC